MVLIASQVEGQTQQYLHFDRQNDFIEVPNASQYIAGAEGITMAGWFWCDELNYGQGMMSFRNGGTGDGEMYLIQLDNGRLECRLIINGVTAEVVGGAFTVVPEQWQHFAWVYDGSKVVLYVNGNVRGSAPASGVIASTDTPFSIGQHISPFNFYYGGGVDEVSLWSKGLTTAEIEDMMENELEGDEEGLELYYKFNQGVPGEDNQTITHLLSETNPGVGAGDGILRNFSLNGETSNFVGDVDTRFQGISFPIIPNKLTTDEPFALNAEASSGLACTYEVLNGPASIDGNMVTLTGTAGEVSIRATQIGNADFDPAKEVDNVFTVIDASMNLSNTDIRSPAGDNFIVPNLGPIPLACISKIDFPDLFEVAKVNFKIDGDVVEGELGKNGHYTAWWNPPSYGNYTLEVEAENNYGYTSTSSHSFEVSATTEDMEANAGDKVWLNVNKGSEEVEITLPDYLGAFENIQGFLDITCPSGGCDPWDRVSGVEIKGHNGEWYEIIRYITPYGVACNSEIDLTDFSSLLHGKVTMRYYLGTQGNGFEYTLDLDYKSGTPDHAYSVVNKLWNKTYPFGEPGNLQPVPMVSSNFPSNTESAKIKLVSTGHGWGENNTLNAAEFFDATHHIDVNGDRTFTQRNWNDCDPNPDACQPQNGTWFYDRAGWCPGTIAQWFDYDMSPYIGGNFDLEYKLMEGYTDFCNPNNPVCQSGITCPNCDDGFNPHLIVDAYLINFGDSPIDANIFPVGNEEVLKTRLNVSVYPNPSNGTIYVETNEFLESVEIRVLNSIGQFVKAFNYERPEKVIELDIQELNKGVYFIELISENNMRTQKIILE